MPGFAVDFGVNLLGIGGGKTFVKKFYRQVKPFGKTGGKQSDFFTSGAGFA